MASEAQAEVQALLSFLTREAKIPLAAALPKYNLMRQHELTTPDAIAKSDVSIVKSIFTDEKTVKQVVNAAKRLSNPKKRAASTAAGSTTAKNVRVKTETDQEEALQLPITELSLDDLRKRVIETNRAPLFLAFSYVLSKYTLSEQPISSRLSLAQAVTSAGAQSKAKFIGLTSSTAEDEGWADGQPKVKLMGRKIAVMRRYVEVAEQKVKSEDSESSNSPQQHHEAFWGIDLDALKKSNTPLVTGNRGSAGLPIQRPEAARSYLLRSINLVDDLDLPEDNIKQESAKAKSKKPSAAEQALKREQAVAMLLKCIDHVCQSWTPTLTTDELDRRASSWYATVRPSVDGGQAGWGQRGKVRLSTILDLAREA